MESVVDVAPAILNRYRLLSVLGCGGLGRVYYGWDIELERPVAIKRLLTDNEPLSTALPTPREDSWREARAMAAIQHANIVTLFDFGEDEEGPYFIMEFINGTTLDAYAAAGCLPNRETVLEISRQTLSGLCAAHEKGLIHRDLKCSNIMLTQTPSGDPLAKILDFGLARFQQQPSEQTLLEDGSFLGSVYYTAPEQLTQGKLDVRTDLYSLGHVLYHYATGHTAFQGESIGQLITLHLAGTAEPLENIRPDLGVDFCQWVDRLMRTAPDDRPASAAQALEELRSLSTGATIGITPQESPPIHSGEQTAASSRIPLTSPTRPRFTIPNEAVNTQPHSSSMWWIGAAGALALGVGGWLLWPSPQPDPPPGSARTDASSPISAPRPVAPQPRPLESPSPRTPEPSVTAASSASITFAPDDLGRLAAHVGREITIEGVPVALSQNRSGTAFYLNFAANYREAVALVMFISDDPQGFSEASLRPFVGRRVTVTGVLESYRGAYQIKCNSLRQIRH